MVDLKTMNKFDSYSIGADDDDVQVVVQVVVVAGNPWKKT